VYLERGLQGWRDFSHWGLLQLGTMPLPADVQTLPLYLWEIAHDTQFDTQNDLDKVLFWMRAGNLVFCGLLLWYALKTGRLLAGPWGGRLAVALLACEPNLLAHAALATTDISVTACMLALLYHFRIGRDAGWYRRLALPAVWFGLAILAKASAIVYGPICLVTIELARLTTETQRHQASPLSSLAGRRAGGEGFSSLGLRAFVVNLWKSFKPAFRDLTWIGVGGLGVATVYCGSDFRTQPAFVEWAHGLQAGPLANSMVWLADNLCIFSNAGEGIVRQIKHNVRGHGTYLLGEGHSRAVWYYFPVLLTIKLSLPVLFAPLVVAAIRARALTNWACLTALVLLAFSLTFRVQLGIRLVLPLVAIALVGLAAAFVNAGRAASNAGRAASREAAGKPRQWARLVLPGVAAASVLWMAIGALTVWPEGLCFVNELWGGTARGYELVSDSNYDWGQGLPELLAWQKKTGADVDVWYFGHAQGHNKPPLHDVPLHALEINEPQDVVGYLQARYFAVSTTMLYGQATTLAAHRNAAAFLRACQPVARTTTFLIFERQALVSKREEG